MARNNALNFNLPSVDDLFSTEESRAEARLEKVVNLNPSEISDFPDHPFKVRMDAAMQEMAESVKQYGVLVPALVRPKQDGGYEMVAGHRRKMAAELAQLPEIPCIVRNLTDDEATIIMVDSNLQREQILPSEKAFAYKMKLDAIRRQPGTRTDLTSVPLGQRLGQTSREALADKSPDSNTQIQRYIRLTHLIPDILELVDNSVLREPEVLQIAMRPAVELSYLRKEEQADLFAIMDEMDCTPSHAQAIKMRQMSEAKTGDERLAKDALVAIMKEEKPNQKEQIKIPKERISKYFAPGTPAQKIEDTVTLGADVFGNITRLDNALENLAGNLDAERAKLEEAKVQLENARTELATPFAREDELTEKTARLKELNILLNMDEKDKTLIDEAPDEGEEPLVRKVVGLER